MSAEVVFNEVWTEDHNPLSSSLPPLPLFHLPSILALRGHQTRLTELQRRTASGTSTGSGRKVMAELMGENKVSFFSVPLLHPSIHHHVITVRGDHRAHEGWSKDILYGRNQLQAFPLLICVGMYASDCVVRDYAFCMLGSGSDWMCFGPPQREACPLPLMITYHRIIVLLLKTSKLY